MFQDTMKQVLNLARTGQPDQGIELLRPFLAQEKTKAPALVAFAYCREVAGNLAEAQYLYEEALRLNPNNSNWQGRRDAAKSLHDKKTEEARKRKKGGLLMLLALLLLLPGAFAGSVLIPGDVGDATMLVMENVAKNFDLEITDYRQYIGMGGAGVGALGLMVLGASLGKRMKRRRAIRAAIGEVFSGKSHQPCRVCGLRYRKRLADCPFCGNPRRKPEEQPVAAEEPPPLPELPPAVQPETFGATAYVHAEPAAVAEPGIAEAPPPLPAFEPQQAYATSYAPEEPVEPPPLPHEALVQPPSYIAPSWQQQGDEPPPLPDNV